MTVATVSVVAAMAVAVLGSGRVAVGGTGRVVMGVLLVLRVHCVPLGVDGLLPDLIRRGESGFGAGHESNNAASNDSVLVRLLSDEVRKWNISSIGISHSIDI